MKFINKLIQLVLFLSFICLIYATSLVGVFSSNQKLTKVLDESGFYAASSKLMADELNKQINSSNSLLNEAIKNSISTSINSDVARSVIQPAQILLGEWLNNPQDKISIDLDLLPIKNKVASKTTDSQVKFEITRLLPDNFQILTESSDTSGILQQLVRIRELYINVKKAIPYIWLVLGSSALLLFILNLGSGSKKFNRILYPVMFASLLGLFIALLSSFASSNIGLEVSTKQGVDNFQLLTKIILSVLKDSFMIFAITTGLSLAGIFVFKTVFRSRDKHLKKKK